MSLLNEYQKLLKQFGPQGWWPIALKYHSNKWPRLTATQKFEIAIGAILAQNTTWKNAERVIRKLHEKKILTAIAISKTATARLERCVSSAGYFRQKAKKLKILAAAWPDLLPAPNRTDLLALWGIGEETADSILLYAFNKPIFVIDAYTRRWCATQGLIFKTYNEYQDYFHKNLPTDCKIFQEFHALLVVWGKTQTKQI